MGKIFLTAASIVLFSLCSHAGVIGNLFESDGRREIRKAEADRIRTEARVAEADRGAIRRLAMASGSQPTRRSGPGAAFALIFGVAAISTALYWLELRRREAMADEIRRLQLRLVIAEAEARESAFERSTRLAELEFSREVRR